VAVDVVVAGVAVGQLRVLVQGLLLARGGPRTIAVAEDAHAVAVLRGLLAPATAASPAATVIDEPRALRAS
jgi:hypothetical protein